MIRLYYFVFVLSNENTQNLLHEFENCLIMGMKLFLSNPLILMGNSNQFIQFSQAHNLTIRGALSVNCGDPKFDARGLDGGPVLMQNTPSKDGKSILILVGPVRPSWQEIQRGSRRTSARQAQLLTPLALPVLVFKGY